MALRQCREDPLAEFGAELLLYAEEEASVVELHRLGNARGAGGVRDQHRIVFHVGEQLV